MGKIIGYMQGYRIVISDGFYEVIDGRVVTHFGKCNKSVTIQEIINQTISVKEKSANVTYRRKGFGKITGKKISRGSMSGSEADETKNVVGL